MLTMDEHEDCQCDHVPPGGAVVLHDDEGPGHMTVAVVTAEVVHPPAVDLTGLAHCSVVSGGSS